MQLIIFDARAMVRRWGFGNRHGCAFSVGMSQYTMQSNTHLSTLSLPTFCALRDGQSVVFTSV